jgi:hypothetical protein
MHWSFDGDGTVEPVPAAMGKSPSWLWKAGKDAAVTPPSQWVLRDAPSKVDTSWAVGNAVIRQYKFYDPAAKKNPCSQSLQRIVPCSCLISPSPSSP